MCGSKLLTMKVLIRRSDVAEINMVLKTKADKRLCTLKVRLRDLRSAGVEDSQDVEFSLEYLDQLLPYRYRLTDHARGKLEREISNLLLNRESTVCTLYLEKQPLDNPNGTQETNQEVIVLREELIELREKYKFLDRQYKQSRKKKALLENGLEMSKSVENDLLVKIEKLSLRNKQLETEREGLEEIVEQLNNEILKYRETILDKENKLKKIKENRQYNEEKTKQDRFL